jgi:hypothetical protein
MARRSNPMAMVLLVVICFVILAMTGAAGWFIKNQAKEGDECEGDDEFGNFLIDSEGKCSLTSCIDGYNLIDDVCIQKPPPPGPPPPPPPAPSQENVTMGASGRAYTIREYSTNPEDDGAGDMRYLVRHDITCDNDAINSFMLQRKADDSGELARINYKVGCLEGVNSGTTDMKKTAETPHGLGNYLFLDRQNVDCETRPISEFKLARDGENKVMYQYKCSTLDHTGECRDVQTEMTDETGGNTYNLDRHDVKCEPGEAMTSFKLIRNALEDRVMYGEKVAYSYKCCKMP